MKLGNILCSVALLLLVLMPCAMAEENGGVEYSSNVNNVNVEVTRPVDANGVMQEKAVISIGRDVLNNPMTKETLIEEISDCFMTCGLSTLEDCSPEELSQLLGTSPESTTVTITSDMFQGSHLSGADEIWWKGDYYVSLKGGEITVGIINPENMGETYPSKQAFDDACRLGADHGLVVSGSQDDIMKAARTMEEFIDVRKENNPQAIGAATDGSLCEDIFSASKVVLPTQSTAPAIPAIA